MLSDTISIWPFPNNLGVISEVYAVVISDTEIRPVARSVSHSRQRQNTTIYTVPYYCNQD